jgi:Ca-activated chloride channel family protein
MNFLLPLGLLFGLFLPAVIILYLLKLKRIDIPIASTLLWRKSLEDLKANTPFQKLKKNLLMYLQLAIIALLTLAAARPVLRLGGLEGQSFIVLIDNSASMSATDVSPSRLEQAKRTAIDLVNDMSVGDRMMVVSYSSNANVLTPFETNKGSLRSTIRSIEPTDSRTDIRDALRIAASSAELSALPELIILSDGCFDIPDDFSSEGMTVRYVPLGESSENVGIIDLVVKKDYTLDQNYEVLVGIQNCGLEEKEIYVELWGEGHVHSVDELPSATTTVQDESESHDEKKRDLMDARKITLGGGVSETILFENPGTFPEKIEVILDSDDILKSDNNAWAIIPQEKHVDVLLVTNKNYYLERVLNLDSRVRLYTVSPTEYVGPDESEIVVFDSFAPENLVSGNYVFINHVPRLPDWTMGEKIELPAIVDWDRMHPLMRYVNLDNLSVFQCTNIGFPSWVEIIAESRETPIILAFKQNDIQAIVTNFDIYDSDWPLRVSFPIFFSNIVNWYTSGEGLSTFMKKTGDVIVLDPPEEEIEMVSIALPDNQQEREIIFSDTGPVYFGDTVYSGIYNYKYNDEIYKKYAVNLLSLQESTVAPKGTLEFQREEIQGEISAVESNREIWRTLAIIALIVLMVEWMIYVKRAKYAF